MWFARYYYPAAVGAVRALPLLFTCSAVVFVARLPRPLIMLSVQLSRLLFTSFKYLQKNYILTVVFNHHAKLSF